MRYAIIENDVVINIIEADADFVKRFDLAVVDENNEAFIGGQYIDGQFTPAPSLVIEDAETV